jgi:hypothetical protein
MNIVTPITASDPKPAVEYRWSLAWGNGNIDGYYGNLREFLDLRKKEDHRFTADEVYQLFFAANASRRLRSRVVMKRSVIEQHHES